MLWGEALRLKMNPFGTITLIMPLDLKVKGSRLQRALISADGVKSDVQVKKPLELLPDHGGYLGW